MNINGYALNTQYQKTQLSYDMSLSKVGNSEASQEVLEENSELGEPNLNIIYMSEDNLNSSEMLSKLILEATYSQYSATNSSQTLFPNIKTTNNEEIPKEIQAYANQSQLPNGLVYTSSSEYYEKTTFDFSGEIKIITPEGEYNIALNLSYTQEFYEKNETFVTMANENLQSPLQIELAEDNENLKNLNSINLRFENIPEEGNQNDQKDLFTQLLESLQERREYIESLLEKSQEKTMDNYQVYMSKNEEEYQLVSAQKDGFGIFFAESKSESSYLNIESNENSTSISTGYSSIQTSSISSFEAEA